MKPFAPPSTKTPSGRQHWFAEHLVLLVLAACLLIGLSIVAWRAVLHIDTTRSRARTEALARGMAVESQLNSAALSAAEILGALAQNREATQLDFQSVASKWLSAHPNLATLEYQPGGIVADIAPRAGQERVIGFNVLMDSTHRPGALAAIQSRRLTVSGPLRLSGGAPGLVIRRPIFQTSQDGQETFWGFVAASIRLPDLLARARLDALSERGYDYVLYAPQTALQPAFSVAGRNWSSFENPVEQVIRAQNLELRLAIQPRAGWFDLAKCSLESLAALGLTALFTWLAILQRYGRDSKAALATLKSRLAHEVTERKLTEDKWRAARETAAAAQARLRQSDRAIAELREQLEVNTQTGQKTAETNRAKLQEADLTIGELRARLEESVLEARAAAQSTQTTLRQNQQTIAELQARLENRHDHPNPTESAEPLPEIASDPVVLNDAVPAPVARPDPTPEPAPDWVSRPTRPKPAHRKKNRTDDQLSLFVETLPIPQETESAKEMPIEPDLPPPAPQTVPCEIEHVVMSPIEDLDSMETESLKPASKPKPVKPGKHRSQPRRQPVDPDQLRTAIKQILPLLIDQDPGAIDCLKDNRTVFRSAFAPELYSEFEHCVKKGDADTALGYLKRAAKKHGLPI